MKTGIYQNSFGEDLSRILERHNISCYKIAQFTDINEAYLSRLRNGEKRNPSPEIIMRISLALAHYSDKITIYEIDALFNSTGRTLFF